MSHHPASISSSSSTTKIGRRRGGSCACCDDEGRWLCQRGGDRARLITPMRRHGDCELHVHDRKLVYQVVETIVDAAQSDQRLIPATPDPRQDGAGILWFRNPA